MNYKYQLSRDTINAIPSGIVKGRQDEGVKRNPASVYFQNRMAIVMFIQLKRLSWISPGSSDYICSQGHRVKGQNADPGVARQVLTEVFWPCLSCGPTHLRGRCCCREVLMNNSSVGHSFGLDLIIRAGRTSEIITFNVFILEMKTPDTQKHEVTCPRCHNY